MSDGVVLQCARVENWPNRATGYHKLPAVIAGSVTAACCTCRAQVWVSKAAVDIAAQVGIKPVCDVCKPAAATRAMPPAGNT